MFGSPPVARPDPPETSVSGPRPDVSLVTVREEWPPHRPSNMDRTLRRQDKLLILVLILSLQTAAWALYLSSSMQAVAFAKDTPSPEARALAKDQRPSAALSTQLENNAALSTSAATVALARSPPSPEAEALATDQRPPTVVSTQLENDIALSTSAATVALARDPPSPEAEALATDQRPPTVVSTQLENDVALSASATTTVLARDSLRSEAEALATDQRPSAALSAQRENNTASSKVAMCMMVLNEEVYLDEFVDYHHALGFDNFFVYDNSQGFEMKQWGKLKGDYVEVIPFPNRTGVPQSLAFQDCVDNLAKTEMFEWVAFFDTDEFLVLKQHDHVADMLKEHCTRGSLGINWLVFHPENWNVQAFEPVTRRFLYWDTSEFLNQRMKSIVRIKDIQWIRTGDTHNLAKLKNNLVMHDTDGKNVTGSLHKDGPVDVAVLHHYRIKSSKEYLRRKLKGRVGADPSTPAVIEQIKERIQTAKQTFASDLASERLPRDGSIVMNPDLKFDDSAWQFLKKRIPGYALFDKIALMPATASPTVPRNDTQTAAISSLKRKKVAMCMIVLNEELYLDEFVDYHHALGFDYFMVYDNSEGFETKQWGMLKGDHVEVIPFPNRTGVSQSEVYRDCVNQLVAGKFKWVAFFNADEFLVLKQHSSVAAMLKEHCPRGSLGVSSLLFGSDQWNVQAFEPVTRRFLYWEASSALDGHIKTIARIKDIMHVRAGDPHNVVKLKNNLVMRDSDGNNITLQSNNGPVDVIALHHYRVKSSKEYLQKRMKGSIGKDYRIDKDMIQMANESFADHLASEHLPRGESIVKNPELIFDDSAWQFLKTHVPGYALFDKIALMPATNNTNVTNKGKAQEFDAVVWGSRTV